ASPALRDFSVTLSPTSVEPALWGHLAVGAHLTSAKVYVRKVIADEPTLYVTYEFKDVTISSFSTAADGGGAPRDTIGLHFGEVTESYRPTDDRGNLGTADVADYDQGKATSGGSGDLAGPPVLGTPLVGLRLDDNNEM